MSEKTPGQAARAMYAALGVEEGQRWELTAQAAIDWWHAERDLEPPREIAAPAFGHRYTAIPDTGVVELHCGTCTTPSKWEVGYHPSLDVLIEQARAHDTAEHGNDSGIMPDPAEAMREAASPELAAVTAARDEYRDNAILHIRERDELRRLLDDIGVTAANAPEDGDSFGLLEEIAMRIAAVGVPDSTPLEEWPDPENPVTGRAPGPIAASRAPGWPL